MLQQPLRPRYALRTLSFAAISAGDPSRQQLAAVEHADAIRPDSARRAMFVLDDSTVRPSRARRSRITPMMRSVSASARPAIGSSSSTSTVRSTDSSRSRPAAANRARAPPPGDRAGRRRFTNRRSSSTRASTATFAAPRGARSRTPASRARARRARRFSSTVSSGNRLGVWNVRPIPPMTRRPIGCARECRPLETSPSRGRGTRSPRSRLKNVVLPAPLGPINA